MYSNALILFASPINPMLARPKCSQWDHWDAL